MILLIASFFLFGTLIFEHGRDLTRMILTGVILGTLFRSLTSFATRMIDPNEYAHIQIASYASFNSFDMDLLYIGVAIIIICLIFVWTIRHRLDVISLGYNVAINLGENVRAVQLLALAVIAILVSVSTALVGPIAFLGLLVVSIAHLLTPSPYHSTLLLSSGLISCIILVGGQTIMERVLGLSTPLAVVIDFVGGLVFLLLLLQRLKKMISIRNLSHQLGQQQILNNLRLTIPKGKVTALVGANGAGKSTLLSLIARLMKLQAGQILIDNMSVGDTPNDALARKLSILPQSIQMEPRLTVRELVSFGRYPHAKGRMQKLDWDKVDEALAVLDLNDLADRQLDTLSGGQRQRAYVAMTYAQDTDYMLLDEPLNNMDIAASRSLMRVLRDCANIMGARS